MSRYSLSYLTKPTLIMVSTYMLIHMVAFFIQFSKNNNQAEFASLTSSEIHLQELIPTVIVHAINKPVQINKKKRPIIIEKKNTIAPDQILPSGEIAP